MRNICIFFVAGFLNNEHVHMVSINLKFPKYDEVEETARWNDLARMRRRSRGGVKKVLVTGTTTLDPVPTDPEPYAPILIGCIMGGIIVFVAFIGILLYLRKRKADNTISLQSVNEKTVAALPKSAPRSNPSSGDDLGSKSIEKKIGPESVGSVEDEKHTIEERRSKKVATSTCLVAKKKHQEYVDARNKEHTDDTKSSKFKKKKSIYIPNEIDDAAFAENPKTPVVKLGKVYYNSKENEQYDLRSDIEELEKSAGVGSSVESVMTAHLSGKVSRVTNKTAKTANAKKVPSVSNVPASSNAEPSAISITNTSTNHSTAQSSSNEAHAQPNVFDLTNEKV